MSDEEVLATLCQTVCHNWRCTLPLGHDGDHKDRSLIDGFVYMQWPQDAEATP